MPLREWQEIQTVLRRGSTELNALAIGQDSGAFASFAASRYTSRSSRSLWWTGTGLTTPPFSWR